MKSWRNGWIVAFTIGVVPITYGCATDSDGELPANHEIIEELASEETPASAETVIADEVGQVDGQSLVPEVLEPAGERTRSPGRAGNSETQRSNTVRADTIPPAGQRRLINDEVRLQGRINTLDRRLRDFDIGMPRTRDAEPSGVSLLGPPHSIDRRLHLERQALRARVKADQRQVQQLQYRQITGSRQSVPGTGSSRGLLRR